MANRTAKQLTSATLSILAPDEVYLVEFYDPKTSSSGVTAKGPQGFGASDGIILLLPFIHSFFVKFIEALGTEAGKKTFSLIGEYASRKDSISLIETKKEVVQSLIEAGMPVDSVDRAADAVIQVLTKN